MRIVFFGSPQFAAIILKRLLSWEGAEVVAVITQPDRPAGRGKRPRATPVKELALSRGIEILQPPALKGNKEIIDHLKNLRAHLFVVVAYGLLLPEEIIYLPPLRTINVHASLLPKYRGAAPIQWAILNGEKVTGITIMEMEKELDTGPILLQRALAIGIEDTAQSLHDELAQMGGELLIEALKKIKEGRIVPISQDHSLASYAPKLTKEMGEVSWHNRALIIHNKIRGLYPWPMAYFKFTSARGRTINVQLFPGEIGRERPEDARPGEVLGLKEDALEIACEDRIYRIKRLRPQGSRILSAREFSCGYL